jgi:hypothetical protein
MYSSDGTGWAGQPFGWIDESAAQIGLDARIKWVGIFDGPGVFCTVFTVALPPDKWEIIVVDDGSADATNVLTKEFISRYPENYNIRLLKNEINSGKGAAVRKDTAFGKHHPHQAGQRRHLGNTNLYQTPQRWFPAGAFP